MIWHILPINDLKELFIVSKCDLVPKVEFQQNGDMLIIHNSFDSRESSVLKLMGIYNENKESNY